MGQVDGKYYFIGHSLGVITILRYLVRLKLGMAKKAIPVPGFTSNLGFKELTNFSPNQGQLEWQKIRSNYEQFVVIHL